MKLETLITPGWEHYSLIDSGLGRKLERIGGYLIDRPEPQAMWQPRLAEAEWEKADAIFMGGNNEDESVHGRWQNFGIDNEQWDVVFDKIKFYGRLTSFRHVGFFPEQVAHWQWLKERTRPGMKILNLFAYSGVHSLVAASKGAEVTHVDASKKAITWAKENQDLNDPSWKIRWIVEDAIKFVEREVKRGNTYDGILLDPPKFGRGPNGETWELFDDLPAHLYDCLQLLKPEKRVIYIDDVLRDPRFGDGVRTVTGRYAECQESDCRNRRIICAGTGIRAAAADIHVYACGAMTKTITSLQNQLVKDAASLHLKNTVMKPGLFLVEGEEPCMAAIANGWECVTLFVAENRSDVKDENAVLFQRKSWKKSAKKTTLRK